jgi:hypothetical protein
MIDSFKRLIARDWSTMINAPSERDSTTFKQPNHRKSAFPSYSSIDRSIDRSFEENERNRIFEFELIAAVCEQSDCSRAGVVIICLKSTVNPHKSQINESESQARGSGGAG